MTKIIDFLIYLNIRDNCLQELFECSRKQVHYQQVIWPQWLVCVSGELR